MTGLADILRCALPWPAGWQMEVRVVSGLLAAGLVLAIGMDLAGLLRGPGGSRVVTTGGTAGDEAVPRREPTDGWLELVRGRRLFKPAIPLPARGMARESVARVRGMLSVHGIMDRQGERVAYINVKGLGMRPLKVGDRVEDLFQVTRIEGKRVEIEITGERVELDL